MANNVQNVTAGKPQISGAIYRALLSDSLTIPTDATSDLSDDFKALGYVSDAGVTNSNSPTSEKIKAWGGDTVLVIQKEKEDEFKLKLIEVMNKDVLAAVYGDDNVSGDIASGMTVLANADEPSEGVWIIDMIMRGDVMKRIVIPDGKVSEVGDIEYVDDDAVGFDLTIQALPDLAGNTHYEYVQGDDASA